MQCRLAGVDRRGETEAAGKLGKPRSERMSPYMLVVTTTSKARRVAHQQRRHRVDQLLFKLYIRKVLCHRTYFLQEQSFGYL